MGSLLKLPLFPVRDCLQTAMYELSNCLQGGVFIAKAVVIWLPTPEGELSVFVGLEADGGEVCFVGS